MTQNENLKSRKDCTTRTAPRVNVRDAEYQLCTINCFILYFASINCNRFINLEIYHTPKLQVCWSRVVLPSCTIITLYDYYLVFVITYSQRPLDFEKNIVNVIEDVHISII